MIGSDDIKMAESNRNAAITIGGSALVASALTVASQPAVGVAFGAALTVIGASVYGFDYFRAGCAFLGSFGVVSYALPGVSSIGSMALVATGTIGVLLSFVFTAIAAIFATNAIAWFVYQAFTFKGKLLTMVKGFLVAPVAFMAAVTNNELPLVGDIGEYVFAAFVVALAFSFYGLSQGREVFQFRRAARDTADEAAARARTGRLGSFLGGPLLGAVGQSTTGEEFGSEQTFGPGSRDRSEGVSGAESGPVSDAAAGASASGAANSATAEASHGRSESGESADRSPSGRGTTSRPCLSCGEAIDPGSDFCPSCGTESPFEPATETSDGSSAAGKAESVAITDRTSEIASAVERQLQPRSQAAKRLCRTLSGRSVDDPELEATLEETVEQLETVAELTETVEAIDREASPQRYERMAERIEREQGPLPEAIDSVLTRLHDRSAERDRQTDEHGTFRADVETVCELAERSDEIHRRGGDIEQRVEALATALRDGSVTITDPGSPVESAVTGVERAVAPSSRSAERLLDALGEPGGRSDVRSALEASVETLEEYAETREMLSEIRSEDVKRRLESLDRELATRDTPIYSHLSDRIRELEASIDGSEAIDDIQLYAIYQEISFYDRTLLPRLSRSMSGTTAENAARSPADVYDRIERIDSEYVDVRPDHNHTIPKHFVDLAEGLTAEADGLLGTAPMQADGLLLVADAVLDHVEELYERNEYSVMLRRLQG